MNPVLNARSTTPFSASRASSSAIRRRRHCQVDDRIQGAEFGLDKVRCATRAGGRERRDTVPRRR
jgi:hypothetical protein